METAHRPWQSSYCLLHGDAAASHVCTLRDLLALTPKPSTWTYEQGFYNPAAGIFGSESLFL